MSTRQANTNINPIILLLPVFIILASCGQQKTEWQGTIEEGDGVTVVKNPKEPMYTGDVLSLEEDLVLGREEKECNMSYPLRQNHNYTKQLLNAS